MSVVDQSSVVGSTSLEADVYPQLRGFAAETDPASVQTGIFAIGSLFGDPGFGSTSGLVDVPIAIGPYRLDRDEAERLINSQSRQHQEWIASAADALEYSTAHLSSLRRATRRPEFELLADEGSAGTTLALSRLTGQSRPLWLFFLQRTVGKIVAEDVETVDEAAARWRDWGLETGLLA